MAGKERRISGIYIPIGLDTTQFQQDWTTLRSQLDTIGASMAGALNASVSPQSLLKNFSQLSHSIGAVRDATRGLQALRPGAYFDQMMRSSHVTQPMRDLAQTLGITEEAQRKLLQTMARNTAINQQVRGLQQLSRVMGTTRQETLELAQSLGLVIDRATKMQFLGTQGRGILGAFSPSNMTAGIQSAMGALGVVGGMYGIVELGKSMTKAALQMENIKLGFESIYGSSTKAATKLNEVREISDRLGLSFTTAAAGAQKLFASINDTEYAQQATMVFEAFASAGAALKLTNDQIEGVFLAVSQTYAKGKVMAEELRGQLSERLPGATTLFAKAIGVTTRELDKMLQDGAVGLEHMTKFAEALLEKYGAAAAAASTGLQAELNRVSNAWFDLRRAFVNTDEMASNVRMLGSAMQFVGKHAETISRVVKEVAKFGAIVGGVYLLTSAIQKLGASFVALRGAMGAGSIVGFLSALGPAGAGLGALSVAIGGLIYAMSNMKNIVSDNDREMQKWATQTFNLEQDIRSLGGAIKLTQEEIKELELTELEKKLNDAKKNLEKLFTPNEPLITLTASELGLDEEDLGGVEEIIIGNGKNAFDVAFNKLGDEVQKLTGSGELATKFESSARSLADQFIKGLQSGMSVKELNKIALDLDMEMSKVGLALSKISNAEEAKSALQKVINMLGNVVNPARTAYTELKQTAEANTELAKSTAESQAAFDAIAKLTKGTATAKKSGLAQDLGIISKKLITLNQNAMSAQLQIDELGSAADISSKDFLNLKNQTEQFEDALPRVADLAIKNGMSFDEVSAALRRAASEADITAQELFRLYDAMQAVFNVRIGDNISKRIEALGQSVKTASANAVQKTLINTFTKDLNDLAQKDKAITQIMAEDWKGLKETVKDYVDAGEVDKALQFAKQLEAGRRSGGGRRRGGASRTTSGLKSAREQMTEFAKATGELEKKIASLQAKYDDDASIKYWADVRGELEKIDNILAKGAGTQTEKEKLAELRKEYEALAKARADQMAEEERRQRAISFGQTASQGYGSIRGFGDMTWAGKGGQEAAAAAIRAQYEQLEIDFRKETEKMGLDYADFTTQMQELQIEANIKIAEANGSLTASFANATMDQLTKVQDWKDQVTDLVTDGINTMSDAFADFLIKGIQNSENLQQAFSKMVQSMISELGQLFMKMMVWSAISKAFGSLFGGGSSAIPAGYKQVGNIEAGAGGGFSGPLVVKAAHGGVFSGGGSISGFSNSIVKGPTPFSFGSLKPFARGGGVMGEAGWEAVMPLIKTRSGNLGVRAEGGGSNVEMNQAISVNIINNTDSQVSAQKSSDSNGNVNIKVMIEKMVGDAMRRPGSAPARALQDVYGAQTVLADR